MRTSILFLVAVATAVVVCAVASPAAAEPPLCPWRRVAHPDDPFIQFLGMWAIQQQPTPLRFDKVESAKAQCVGEGTSETRNYELIIDAATRDAGPGEEKFKAVVFVMNFRFPQNLTFFDHIKPGHLTAPRLYN